jgi:hypothetical protein
MKDMKISDLVQGGIYMFHTTTPEQCHWYNDCYAEKLVVISTRPYHVELKHWQTSRASVSAAHNSWTLHDKKSKPWQGPKFILCGVLNWNPHGGPQQGTKIKEFKLVQPRFIRMPWDDFRKQSRNRALVKRQQEDREQATKDQNSRTWQNLKHTLEYLMDSDFPTSLDTAIRYGEGSVRLYADDVQALIDVIERS